MVSCRSWTLRILFAARSCRSLILIFHFAVVACGSWTLRICFAVGHCRSWILIFHFALVSCGSWTLRICFAVRSCRSWIIIFHFVVVSCGSWTFEDLFCREILQILDLEFQFAVWSCGSWILFFVHGTSLLPLKVKIQTCFLNIVFSYGTFSINSGRKRFTYSFIFGWCYLGPFWRLPWALYPYVICGQRNDQHAFEVQKMPATRTTYTESTGCQTETHGQTETSNRRSRWSWTTGTGGRWTGNFVIDDTIILSSTYCIDEKCRGVQIGYVFLSYVSLRVPRPAPPYVPIDLYKIQKTNYPACVCGHDTESVRYYILACPLCRNQRNALFHNISKGGKLNRPPYFFILPYLPHLQVFFPETEVFSCKGILPYLVTFYLNWCVAVHRRTCGRWRHYDAEWQGLELTGRHGKLYCGGK